MKWKSITNGLPSYDKPFYGINVDGTVKMFIRRPTGFAEVGAREEFFISVDTKFVYWKYPTKSKHNFTKQELDAALVEYKISIPKDEIKNEFENNLAAVFAKEINDQINKEIIETMFGIINEEKK